MFYQSSITSRKTAAMSCEQRKAQEHTALSTGSVGQAGLVKLPLQ